MRVLFAVLALLLATVAAAQTPTPCPAIRWQQDNDSATITEWRLCLNYVTTQTCTVGHILTIPRAEATPEATPGQYRACIPSWLRPDQPELYLIACDAGGCSGYSNAWPTRTWSPAATLTPTGTPPYTPTYTWTPAPTITPTPLTAPLILHVCVNGTCVDVPGSTPTP